MPNLAIILLLTGVVHCLDTAAALTVEDVSGALGQTQAPVAQAVTLTRAQLAAAQAGRLGLVALSQTKATPSPIPVQWSVREGSADALATWLMPAGATGKREFEWRDRQTTFPATMQARTNAASGQIELTEGGKPVLRYNYRTIEPGALLDKVAPGNRIYARARSDYIHPLYGPDGEVLTRDWPVDHPHHRGIYWAWPEVDFGKERGDLHALQKVFARPTGKVQLQSGPVYAQITAENRWLWEDREPIVREVAVIRAYRATARGRVVDLAFQFTALKDGITVARRDTTHYGGLNLRMATPKDQLISTHSDAPGSVPRRAWSDLSGVFGADTAPSGLTVLQDPRNPDYPGDWVQYPELSWCQPTFPASGTRYPLRRGQPLVLRFRLWAHTGGKAMDDWNEQLWDAAASPAAPALGFEFAGPKSDK